MRKTEDNFIEILEEVKVGNVILEKGDRIKLIERNELPLSLIKEMKKLEDTYMDSFDWAIQWVDDGSFYINFYDNTDGNTYEIFPEFYPGHTIEYKLPYPKSFRMSYKSVRLEEKKLTDLLYKWAKMSLR